MSRLSGYDRGLPIDRYYIERFLEQNADLVRGAVLEVGDDAYTRRFGGARVSRCDVLNISPHAPGTTIVDDLSIGSSISDASFDCLVITQTLQLIYDLRGAVQTMRRILKPGGTLLATFPGITPISGDQWGDQWYWSLTALSAHRLFTEEFGDEVEVEAHGNVLAAVGFLEGLAVEDLDPSELDVVDPQFPIVITVKASRAEA